MDLRATIASDLAETLEGEFAISISLISPTGVRQDGVKAQVLYDSKGYDPQTGDLVIVHTPVVTVRRSSLTSVPAAGERWAVLAPSSPLSGATLNTYAVERASEDGGSFGFVRLYLTKTRQSPPPPEEP